MKAGLFKYLITVIIVGLAVWQPFPSTRDTLQIPGLETARSERTSMTTSFSPGSSNQMADSGETP